MSILPVEIIFSTLTFSPMALRMVLGRTGWLGAIGGRSLNGGRGMGEPGRKGLVSPLRWGSQVYSQTRRIS